MRPKSKTRPAVWTLAAVCPLMPSASCNGADERGGGQAADTFEEIPFSPDGGTFSCTNDHECMMKCPTWSLGCRCAKKLEQWSCSYDANPRYAPMAEEDALRMLVEYNYQEHIVWLIESKTLSNTERNALAERIANIMITAPRKDCRGAVGFPGGCLRKMARNALLLAAKQGSVDPLFRAYETAEAERKCRMLEEPMFSPEGEQRWRCEGPHPYSYYDVELSDIADCCDDVGFEYVRRVFRTAERPPPESATEYGYGRDALLRTPWCQAGQILFSDEINRAYGWPEGARPSRSFSFYQRPEPLRRQVSDDAAAWWEICWDGRNTKPKKRWWPFG